MSWLDPFFTKGYVTLQIAGVPLVAEKTINIVSGATAVDNATLGRTDVTITLPTLPLSLANGGTAQAGGVVAVPALAIDWTAGGVFTKALASGGNTFTFSNAAGGMVIIVRLTSNAGGSTVTWPTVKWAAGVAPTQSTPSKIDVYTFIHDGTSIYGSVVQAMA